jgi:hypothetical protein
MWCCGYRCGVECRRLASPFKERERSLRECPSSLSSGFLRVEVFLRVYLDRRVVLMLALVAAFVENLVCAEKCSLRVELPGETIRPESCVFVAGDSEGEELVSPVIQRERRA